MHWFAHTGFDFRAAMYTLIIVLPIGVCVLIDDLSPKVMVAVIFGLVAAVIVLEACVKEHLRKESNAREGEKP